MSRATYRTVAEILEQAKREEWPTSAFSARPSAEQHLIDGDEPKCTCTRVLNPETGWTTTRRDPNCPVC